MSKNRVLGVIPARGGSKTIPRKNIMDLAGKPLIAHTITAALKSRLLSKVIVSTDDSEIAEVAKKFGADVPFIRPAALASDTALAVPVIQHATRFMEDAEKAKYDYVVMLQPTTPLRQAEDIDGCIEKLTRTGADSVISVVDVGAMHPARMKRIVDDMLVDYAEEEVENMPRQKLPLVYIRNGAVYATKRDVLMDQNTFKGKICRPYIMPEDRSVNIDTPLDLMLIESLIRSAQKKI